MKRLFSNMCQGAVAAGLALAALTGTAVAQSDRDQTVPTGWYWYHGVSSATITNMVANGWRPFDIDRASASTFDTCMVWNGGAYNKSNSDWYNLNEANLNATLGGQNQRLIDIEPYDAGASVAFQAVAISNTGADAAGWGWLYGQTQASLVSWISNSVTPLRIIDLDRYDFNGTMYYSGVAVVNTGQQAQGWWWYFDRTPAQINQLCSDLNARLVTLEPHDNGNNPTFDIVLAPRNGMGWWWYYGLDDAGVNDLVDLNAARLIDIERYTDGGGATRFAVIMNDNANPLEQNVRWEAQSQLAAGAEGGGFMKVVGGSALCQVGEDHIFEPASMLKILYGAYAIDRCAAGTDNLANLVFVGDTVNNNECPDGVQASPGFETLSIAIAEMLEQSDNNRTKVIHDRYTRATLNAYADALGMSRTNINHDIGCGLPANQLTLRDAGLLYERIADATLFSQAWQDQLYALMLDSTGNQGGFSTEISNQAVGLSLTASEISAFKDDAFRVVKGGSYGVGGLNHRTSGGWMRLPWKTPGGTIYFEEYSIQSFVNDEPNGTLAGNVNGELWWIMARDRIRAALESWDDACTSPVINNQPDSIVRTEGANAVFQVGISGVGAATYQWRRNNVNIVSGNGPGDSTYSGYASNTLTISNVSDLNEAQYDVVITRVCGSTTSIDATLTVVPPPCDSVDFDGDGDTGTDADIEAFFACLGGNCCATCGDVDFNNDGDTGTDSDIEAFFTALGGGRCD